MSRPKRPVNGRISVHTSDILDELLDDNDKHEMHVHVVKVKSFFAFAFRLFCIFRRKQTGPYLTSYNHFLVLIYNVVIIAGSTQTSGFRVFSRENKVFG